MGLSPNPARGPLDLNELKSARPEFGTKAKLLVKEERTNRSLITPDIGPRQKQVSTRTKLTANVPAFSHQTGHAQSARRHGGLESVDFGLKWRSEFSLQMKTSSNCGQPIKGKLPRSYRRGCNDALSTLVFALDDEFGEAGVPATACNAEVCRRLRFGRSEVSIKTNQELAALYGCSPRTIQYWRSQGAPLEQSGKAMIRWLAKRPRLPKRTGSRLGRRLALERIRAGIACLGPRGCSGR